MPYHTLPSATNPSARAFMIYLYRNAEQPMNVKQAVTTAKQHILDLFADENLANLGLEEVEFDDQASEWRVTIGFSRPWDEPPRSPLAALANAAALRRTYKVVRISDSTSHVLSVKTHETAH
jgi:hypothetical protein